MHFICFVHKDGKLYELDGRKDGPVEHGASSAEGLLPDAARVIREKYMSVDPTEHRFTIMALSAATE